MKAIARAVERWFAGAKRELPWRVASDEPGLKRDPYLALVAEAMLQQTQVSRVVPKFEAFVAQFPDVQTLAAASEDDVLGMWTGLGYYRRARSLHAAAKTVVRDFGGRVPSDVESLLKLKGVGRYTAGAVASIAFDRPEPIVDGNVARVLLRVFGVDAASDEKSVQGWLWSTAKTLVDAADSPGVFNEGLMELGATVCIPPPGTPACLVCPLRDACNAHQTGRELEIPRPKARAAQREVRCASVVVVRETNGAVLVEQRPVDGGMWGGLWQAPTIESEGNAPTKGAIAGAIGLPTISLSKRESFEFSATHRRLWFDVYVASVDDAFAPTRGMFVARNRLKLLGMGTPQRRMLGLD